jgi:hypothetical protein
MERVEQEENRIALTFYVAPDLSDAERDDLSEVGTIVIADYTGEHELEERFIVVRDKPAPQPTWGTWVLRSGSAEPPAGPRAGGLTDQVVALGDVRRPPGGLGV